MNIVKLSQMNEAAIFPNMTSLEMTPQLHERWLVDRVVVTSQCL